MEQMAKGAAFHTVQISRISDLLCSLEAVLEIYKFAGKGVGVGKLRSEEGRNNFQHSARGSTTKKQKQKQQKKWYVTSL